LTELIRVLQAIPTDRFWDHAQIEDPLLRRRAAQRPEVELLMALEHLRTGQMMEAVELFSTLSDEARALQPVAVTAIRAVLRWRLVELAPDFGFLPPAPDGAVEHTLMTQLRNWPAEGLGKETREVLQGPDVATALMLAAGWPQAALMMRDPVAGEADDAPEWLPFGVAASLRQVEGVNAALTYLQSRSATPALRLLAAEIMWSKDPAQGRLQLRGLSKVAGDVGFRASWLLATAALNEGKAAEAVKVVEDHEALRESPAGQELLARAALALGMDEKAGAIYAELGPVSLDAGLWLAREAFVAEDWENARSLTLELIDRFPAQIELRRNLQTIAAAEAEAGP